MVVRDGVEWNYVSLDGLMLYPDLRKTSTLITRSWSLRTPRSTHRPGRNKFDFVQNYLAEIAAAR